MTNATQVSHTNDRVMTKRDTAIFLGISVETLDRLDRKGDGPDRFYVGSQVRYLLSRTLAWLSQQDKTHLTLRRGA
jgi:predicted DNA-binding transcriptional regulator AlpA